MTERKKDDRRKGKDRRSGKLDELYRRAVAIGAFRERRVSKRRRGQDRRKQAQDYRIFLN